MIDDDMSDMTDEEEKRRADIIRRARVEGIEAAYNAALRVCQDSSAPSQAVSNASRTLLQIGGLLDRADRQENAVMREPHEMSSDELAKAAAKAQRNILRRAGGNPEAHAPNTDEDTGAFG